MKTPRLAGAAVLVAAACLASSTAMSEPQAFFETALMNGVGNTVSLLQVPVQTATGKIVYRDVEIVFSVAANGKLKVASTAITDSPTIKSGSFVAGTYVNGTNSAARFVLSGPSIDAGGRTTWSITGTSQCAFTAGWTSGPVSGHPQQQRLKKAAIPYAGYSYGTSGTSACFPPTFFSQGHLIGAAGSATGLTLFSYTDDDGDHAAPVGQISFTRCTSPCS
jgi:hypothetical protein